MQKIVLFRPHARKCSTTANTTFLHTDCSDDALGCCLPNQSFFPLALAVSSSRQRRRRRHRTPIHHVGCFRPESHDVRFDSVRQVRHYLLREKTSLPTTCSQEESSAKRQVRECHPTVIFWLDTVHTQTVCASWSSSVNSIVFCCRLSRTTLSSDMRWPAEAR